MKEYESHPYIGIVVGKQFGIIGMRRTITHVLTSIGTRTKFAMSM